MRQRIITIAVCLLAMLNTATAADNLTISDFTVLAGQTKELAISLESDAEYAAFQFDLYPPDGITVKAFSASADRIPASTTLSMSQLADGGYRFLAVAMQGVALKGNSGPIVNVTIETAADVKPGEYAGYFRTVKLAKADATGQKYVEMSFPVTVVASSLAGDANGDGEVNITDITYVLDKINGKPSADFVESSADVNGDGEINITDVTMILDIINAAK